LTFDNNRRFSVVVVTGYWKIVILCRAFDAGQYRQTFDGHPIKRSGLLQHVVFGKGRVRPKRQQRRASQAGIDLHQPREASHQQPRYRQQQGRQGYFGDNQNAAARTLGMSSGGAARRALQSGHRIRPRHAEGGRNSRESSRHKRCGERKQQHAPVRIEGHPLRQFHAD
jgi:hypothetical protein